MAPSNDQVDPAAIYVVRDGPLKGGMASILEVQEDGKRIRALVSRGNLLTPPILIDASLLKKMPTAWWAPEIRADWRIAVPITFFACYLLLMGVCLLLWGFLGPTRTKDGDR